ncbi:MAG: hypothetical protein KatS3mg105_1286 [Gemmatales bacterium]|nr:MAG: hypothetical protein KatS3mg105_1286 [Gemmatales bacterium]
MKPATEPMPESSPNEENPPLRTGSAPGSKVRLAVAALAFIAWIGYLAFLAATASNPIVLSRPQLMAAEFDLLAHIEEADGRPKPRIEVKQVLWSHEASKAPSTGSEVEVANLPLIGKSQGWSGPGDYIVPLVRQNQTFVVPPIPPSPGFSSIKSEPRIYRATPEAIAQLYRFRQRN